MRNFLLFLILSLISTFSFGQIFEIYSVEGDLINNDDTIVCSGSGNDLLAEHAYLKNVSAVNQIVYVKKSYVSTISGAIDAFCWAGNCYTSMQSPNAATITPGSTDSTFSTEFMPQDNPGTSIIRYTFFTGHNDSTWFFVKYIVYPTNVNFTSLYNSISNPFPNPAKDNINIMVSRNDDILTFGIYDLTGKEIRSINYSSTGVLKISVSDLKKGIYFLSVKSQGRIIKTSKIIVTN